MEEILSKAFLDVKDVQALMEVSQSKAYVIIKKLNQELNDQGYISVHGKVSTSYFKKCFYC